jgi:hypothetical protein
VFGIVIALWQIGQQSHTAKLTFENLFVAQYQQLIQRLPIKALLGDALSDQERTEYLGELYHYIDLCNTQAYHRRRKRITAKTWQEWREGIEANLRRKELEDAWSYIAAKSPEEFMDLRTFVPPRPLDDNNPYKRMR